TNNTHTSVGAWSPTSTHRLLLPFNTIYLFHLSLSDLSSFQFLSDNDAVPTHFKLTTFRSSGGDGGFRWIIVGKGWIFFREESCRKERPKRRTTDEDGTGG
ncbi:hypothetical protein A2U01_0058417, partial [Trifolium medium]|nr:hypothetical protein [Trifolium medium]